jgi:hypothetical protein
MIRSLVTSVARRYDLPVSQVIAMLPDEAALIMEIAAIRYDNALGHAHEIKRQGGKITAARYSALVSEDPDQRLAATMVYRDLYTKKGSDT